ncbi:glycosyltransferase [Streptomyces sp. NPDC016309]|uniref:glycosyltransferase n=1 Tax=Streptomyces sp. NPDC016309 TaxID=3364965 RepID=UPI0037024D4D
MTIEHTAADPRLLPSRPDHVTAVRGARWITAAAIVVGALNYGYALLLTRLLDADSYAVFAAGQGMVQCAATIAVVAVPWVLAQALARAASQAERANAIRFAIVIAVAGGVLCGGIVAAVAAQFAGGVTTLVLAGVTLLIYVTRVTNGWLQGTERMLTLAGVVTAEAVLKLTVGLLLVSALGWGETGALAAFGIAVLPFVVWWPFRGARGADRRWLDITAHRDLWRRALELSSVQGMVALMATVDVVLVALLPAAGAAAASFQASMMMGRAPLFVAGAVSVAFFPALSRRRAGSPLAGNAVRMYLSIALPVTAVCATAPEAVIARVFPSDYTMMSSLLLFAAVSGFALGGINLISTFFQAVNDRTCLRIQAAGLVIFMAALLTGWQLGGVRGLAVGGAFGSVAAMVLLGHRLARAHGFSLVSHLPLVEPVVVVGALFALRSLPVWWLVAAVMCGGLAVVRFVRERAVAPPESPGTAPRRRVVISTFDYTDNKNYHGGGAVVIDKVARRLSEEFDVLILSAAQHGGTQVIDGVRRRYLGVGRAGPRAGQVLFQAALPLMARRIPHDVWLESFSPPFGTSFLPLFTKAPVVGLSHCRSGDLMWRKYRVPAFLVERAGLHLYRHLVVLNEADAADLRRQSPRATVHLIENGVDRRDIAESDFGCGTCIVCLGRIDTEMKGIALLVSAYRQATTDMPLIIAGQGTPAEERKLVELLATTTRDVRWVGYADAAGKHRLLTRCAFMVMPSRQETFGLVALEAMSYGKPVVHFDLPSLQWMSGRGDVAVPHFDVKCFADQIDRLASDEPARRALGRRAYVTAQHYSWDEMTDRYLKLVQQLPVPPTGDCRDC